MMEPGLLGFTAYSTFSWALWKALDAMASYFQDPATGSAPSRTPSDATAAVAALATLADPLSPLSLAVTALQESSHGSLAGLSDAVGQEMRHLTRDEQGALALMLAGAVVEAQAAGEA